MDRNTVLEATRRHVQATLQGEGSGHDWWHVWRVTNSALRLAAQEGADPFVVELAALLHDIRDWKFCDGDEAQGPAAARQWLASLGVDTATISHVGDIVRDLSFKGAGVETPMATLEGQVVQDADRLDAIGALGIARAFAYGGHKGRELHNPSVPPTLHPSFEQYKRSAGPTLNHFYEKLLLLKDRMNTPTAKAVAQARHAVTEQFLVQFLREWEGVDLLDRDE